MEDNENKAIRKYKLKAFLWDQFILPLYSIFKLEQLMAIIIAVLVLNFISFKSSILFLISSILLIAMSIFDIVKYYKSGEFLKNYREHKYPEYRKAIKDIRRKRKQEKITEGIPLESYPMEDHIGINLDEGDKEALAKNGTKIQ